VEASDAAAIVVAFVSALAVAAIVWAVVALRAAVRELRDAAVEFRTASVPALDDLRATVTTANDQLERVDGLLGTAESVTATVDAASRLAYLTFSNPAIKVLAFATGTGRAARRLRRARRVDGGSGRPSR
jgi:hypothetical protein